LEYADFEHVYTLQRGCPPAQQAGGELKADEKAMDVPSAPRIAQLSQLPPRFEDAIGTAAACDKQLALMQGLWTCGDLVDKALAGKRGGGARRVIVLTNDTTPLRPGSDGASVLQRAAMLKQALTNVQVLPLADGVCAPGSFWHQLHNDPDAGPMRAPAEGVEQLRERLRRKVHKKRRLCALELVVCPGGAAVRPDPVAAALTAGPSGAAPDAPAVRIGVGLYSLVAPASKGAAVKVHRTDFSVVKAQTSFIDPHTGTALAPEQMARALDYPAPAGREGAAPDKLVVPSATAAALKRTGLAPDLRVLGFVPTSAVTRATSLRAPYFAYPEEARRPGSTVAFTALLRAMLDRDVAALAVLVRAPGAAPRLAALMPQREVRDGDTQRVPPGLHVVPLPWAEDQRSAVPAAVLPPARRGGGDDAAAAQSAEAEARCVRTAADLVRSLRLVDFRCENFENPSLQRYYAYLESLALAEEFRIEKAPEDEDDTLPAPLSEAHAAAAAAFAAEIGHVAAHPEDADAGGGAPPSRKRKPEAGSADAEDVEAKRRAGAEGVSALLAAGPDQLARATNPELKAWLAAAGLKVSGNKAELIERVLQHAHSG
jgi:ATP-dependent DNA helicase 2 subunit 1